MAGGTNTLSLVGYQPAMPRIHWICLAAVLLGFPGLAAAQNFVRNGFFASDIAGWTAQGSGSAAYSGSAGAPDPGAAHLSITDPTGNGLLEELVQCIAVGQGADYTVTGNTLADPASSAGVQMSVLVRFLSGFNCTGTILSGTVLTSDYTVPGIPSDFTYNKAHITAPGGAHTLQIYADLQSTSAGTAGGWFDSISVTSTDVIFVDSFEQVN